MLTSTFCHIPGIGEKTERGLWAAGLTSWEAAVKQAPARLPRSLLGSWVGHIEESVRHYEGRNSGYFADKLPANQQWRLYRDFKDSCAFVDIETTGLDWSDEITTIVLYDGRTVRYYVNGQNLNDFPADVMSYRLLVTYNGKSFDVPFIERYFRIRLSVAHIDLKHPLASLGFKGGLKGCERKLGIRRPGLEEVDGYVAVLLWDQYRNRKNLKALETLLAYNFSDTVALHTLAVHCHNEKVKATPFSSSHCLPPPSIPEGQFRPDREIVVRIQQPLYDLANVRSNRTFSLFSPGPGRSGT